MPCKALLPKLIMMLLLLILSNRLLQLSLTDQCFVLSFFLNINSSFWSNFVAQLKTASCFTVGGMTWSNALCLAFFLLTLNNQQYDFFDWLSKNLNFVKFCFFNKMVVQQLCILLLLLVHNIWRSWNLTNLFTTFLYNPKFNKTTQLWFKNVGFFQLEILLQL